MSDTDELTDNHFGLIFVAGATAADAPDARPAAPPARLGVRETWVQLRHSSALKDLLAECALWWASCTGLPLYQHPDGADEFALCASACNDLRFYDYPDTAVGPQTLNQREE